MGGYVEKCKCEGLFINPKDLTKKELENINNFDVVIGFADLGDRGNLRLVPCIRGFKIIKFNKGVRVK